jgi:ribonuclease R
VKPTKDPHASRESQKYAKPIASRELILEMLAQSVGPMPHKKLVQALGIEDDDDFEALRRRLNAMERDGQIHSNRKKAYAIVDKLNLIRGKIQGHRDGYGFVLTADGDDVYLPSRQMRKVFHGDEVLARQAVTGVRGRRDGVIVEVVSHNTEELVGRYYFEQGYGFVRPDNARLGHDVLVTKDNTMGATHDQFVTVAITRQPSRDNLPMGKIVEVLGDHMAPGMEIDVAIRAHDLPHQWPADVKTEAAELAQTVEASDKENRIDCRTLPFVTIDGEDARDFDDAVFCEAKKSGGWRLYVAIADVSHYVTINSALDDEAQVRSTSVYFPDFVLPMLPEALSNGLCSLNPKVDRLAMVCEMTVSATGKVSGYQFYESVIYSHARLTYTKVGEMLDAHQTNHALREEYKDVVAHIDELHALYKVLRVTREARGAIDFETTETRILFDDDRKIDKIVPVVRNDAHKLIEECMLCANVSAAKFIEKHELDGLFRVHNGPKEQKLTNLKTFLGALGLSLPSSAPAPADYQRLLEKISDRPDSKIIQTVMLRSLSQAMYQPDNNGHFGLAYDAYAHFTSPIRRYPDLLVHRAIRSVIRSKKQSIHVKRADGAPVLSKHAIYPYSFEDMVMFGEHTSMAERRADEATRDVVSWLKCEYLQNHVGDIFQGVVTGVTNFGLFVELLDVYVEGLIHITGLPSDYYRFEEAHHRLLGERTNRVFSLGDVLTVQVAGVKLDERKVDFELIEDPSQKKANDTRRKKYSEQDKDTNKKTDKSPKAPRGSKGKFSKKSKAKKPAVTKVDGASENKKPRKKKPAKKKKVTVPEPALKVAEKQKKTVKEKIEKAKKNIKSFFKT